MCLRKCVLLKKPTRSSVLAVASKPSMRSAEMMLGKLIALTVTTSMKANNDLEKIKKEFLVMNGYFIYEAYSAACQDGPVEPEHFADCYIERCFPAHSFDNQQLIYRTFIERLTDKK
jgi:hypothetical protein